MALKNFFRDLRVTDLIYSNLVFANGSTIVRKLKDSKSVYLTFDDGPELGRTELVLDLLKKYNAKATFFMVAEKAIQQKELVFRILNEGHAVGNHSLDHSYNNFFKPKKDLKEWILKSQEKFKELGIETIGFRPPAGVVTPPLVETCTELSIPLILWNQRFFDTRYTLSKDRALVRASGFKAGDIVLLHDSTDRLQTNLPGIETLIVESKSRFELEALPRTKLDSV
jgi:peptidoglycan/xylan/chitin deacetylase (PgdA/CDA1 family)